MNHLFVCFLPSQMSCGIFVLWPGIKPMTLAVKAKNSKNWTAREFMQICFKQLPSSHGFGFLVGTKEVMCRITETFQSIDITTSCLPWQNNLYIFCYLYLIASK